MSKFRMFGDRSPYCQTALTEEGDVYSFSVSEGKLKSTYLGNLAEQRKQKEALESDKKAALEKLTVYERTILGLPRDIE